MQKYLYELNNYIEDEIIKGIKKHAVTNDIPIICDEGLLFLLHLIKLTKSRRILEIGTAIAYSAINIALVSAAITIDTIEKNKVMYDKAILNVRNAKLEKQINIILGDGLYIEKDTLKSEYDLIFIDAAKAQYIKYFEKFDEYLKRGGIIICDNLLFHGYVINPEKIETKNMRALVSKINEFNCWLSKNERYDTIFYSLGDGMSVSEKL